MHALFSLGTSYNHLERDGSILSRIPRVGSGGEKRKVSLRKQPPLFRTFRAAKVDHGIESCMAGRSRVNVKPSSRICSEKNTGLETGQNLDLNSGHEPWH